MQKIIYFDWYNFKGFPYRNAIENLIPDDAFIEDWYGKKLAENLLKTYKEAVTLNFREDIIKMLILIEAKNICPQLMVDFTELSSYVFDIYKALKDNKEFLSQSDYNSRFLTVLRLLCPLLVDMEQKVNSGEIWSALMSARNIFDILLSEGMTPDMTENEVKRELCKEYAPPEASIYNYKFRMKKKEYPNFNLYDIGENPEINTYSRICKILIISFTSWLKDIFRKENCYYTPLNDDFSFYYLRGIKILTYKYDDNVDLYFDIAGKRWRMNNYRFWEFIDSTDLEKLQVRLKMRYPELIGTKFDIVCPWDAIDEALSLLLKRADFDDDMLLQVSKSLGIKPALVSGSLIRLYPNNGNYIRNPKEYDKLRIKDLDSLPTLKRILSFQGEQRAKYLKKLSAKAKGDFNNDFGRRENTNAADNTRKMYID